MPTEDFVCEQKAYHRILFGGDQLTACRCRGAQSVRCNDDDIGERFLGFIPVTEDWHARQTLMRVNNAMHKFCEHWYVDFLSIQVIWKRLFTKASSGEKGTLYQLRNMLHRTGVPLDPGDNMKSAEDFLMVILHSHIVAAAKVVLSNNEHPLDLQSVSKSIVQNYININLPSIKPSSSTKSADQVNVYAKEVLSLGLLWLNFYDSIKEADGERIVRNWKFNLCVFKAAQQKNYAIEAVNLLLQVQYLLSPREAAQVMWSRCVNTSGRQGCNIPMDLHMEHMNRRIKSIMSNMGSNLTNSSVTMAAQSLGVVSHVCQLFEKQCELSEISNHHSAPSFNADFKIVLNTLVEQEVFLVKSNRRKHDSFKFTSGLIEETKRIPLLQWIKTTVRNLCV